MTPLLRAALGIAVGAVVVALLAFGLTREARVLPSVTVGKPAPVFELENLAGRRVASEQRDKPMVINFWASWCSECRKEHPLLMAAHDRFGNQIDFVGIIFQDSAKNARDYLVEMGDVPAGSYPNLLDPRDRTAIDYGVYGVPETFFVDRRGLVTAKWVGRMTPEILDRELSRLLR